MICCSPFWPRGDGTGCIKGEVKKLKKKGEYDSLPSKPEPYPCSNICCVCGGSSQVAPHDEP